METGKKTRRKLLYSGSCCKKFNKLGILPRVYKPFDRSSYLQRPHSNLPLCSYVAAYIRKDRPEEHNSSHLSLDQVVWVVFLVKISLSVP